MVRLADPNASRVLLIGSSRYDTLRPELPAVANNVHELARLLRDPDRWGVPEENCRVLLDPASPLIVDRALATASSQARSGGLLLVYYAGHGIVGADRRLCLALPGTDANAPHSTAVPYDWVQMAIRNTMAERRVVILDCCYAGRAQMGRTEVRQLADRVAVDRTCLLLAAAEDEQAIAPPGARYTAFTGELIDLLTRGIDKGPRLLDVQTLWDHLYRRLTANGYPGPELRAGNAGDNLPITNNPVPHSRDRHGQVLYASPYVSDPDLHQAVVLILRHNPGGGTVGVVINRPTTIPVSEVASDWYDLCSIPPVVFAGGPVPHEGHIPLALLRPRATAPLRFRPIAGRLGTLALSAQLSTVEDLVEGFRLFSGYVGWGPGELEADIAQEVLIPTDEPARVVFTAAVRTLWQYLQRPR